MRFRKKKKRRLLLRPSNRYDIGVKNTEDALKAQVIGICRGYCLQAWTEALNLAGVEASLDLRETKKSSILQRCK